MGKASRPAHHLFPSTQRGAGRLEPGGRHERAGRQPLPDHFVRWNTCPGRAKSKDYSISLP